MTMDDDKTITANFTWPQIKARPKIIVHAFDWPNGTPLTLTIDLEIPSMPRLPSRPPANPGKYVAEFHLEGFDLQPGQLLTVSDNGNPATIRNYTPANSAITAFNVSANTMLGTATPSGGASVF